MDSVQFMASSLGISSKVYTIKKIQVRNATFMNMNSNEHIDILCRHVSARMQRVDDINKLIM